MLVREYNRVIWYYKLSWQHKLATKKSFKGDISSFSPSITQSIILNYPVPCTHIALLYHYTLCCFVEDMIPPVETKLITSIIANLIVKKRNTRKLIKYINKLQGERDREITNSAVKRVRYNQVNTLTNTFFRTLFHSSWRLHMHYCFPVTRKSENCG